MKKKILFIMHMPPPVHGAAMVGKWIHDSKTINHEFDCFYINPSVSNSISDVGKVKIKKIYLLVSLIFRIIISIYKIKPDLCYYTPTSDGWGIYRDALTIFLIRVCRVKIVLHLHNKGVKNYSRSKYARYAYNIIFHRVKVILIANELLNDIEQFVSRDDIFILPNGIPQSINEEEYKEILAVRHQNPNKNRLLYLSNMMSEKGIWVLLEACKILSDAKNDFECHFVGNWGDTTNEEFQNEINKRGLNNKVFCHGPKYGDDKKYFFMNSDIFIFPTFYHGETFGLVLLEAMEYGLPCITTPEGGIPSFISHQNGILVKQKDSHELSIAIKKLIDGKEERENMGCNGRQLFIKKYTLQNFEKNFVDILKKII